MAEPDFSAAAAERKLLAVPLLVTLAVGILVVLGSAAFRGAEGAVGAAVGLVVVAGFFGTGQAVVARTLRSRPNVAMSVALMVYLVQIVVLFVLLVVLRSVTWFDPRAFAASIFAGVIAWTIASVATILRVKVLAVEPGSGPPGAGPGKGA